MTAADASQRAPSAPGRPEPSETGQWAKAADRLIAAAQAVSAARVRYAEAFLRYKMQDVTDGQAHQQALLATNDELTVLQARLEIARWKLGKPS